MKVTTFSELVTKREKGKKEISIAQVKEVLKIIKDLLIEHGQEDIYKAIRRIK
ncbi:MAG: hypothetical protein BMS9Abin02_2127 [Anaerolineae bacterium]|nr:MAG: hypothetical protein BMS9Abin02_2127 [Anaerolineae bacterium]